MFDKIVNDDIFNKNIIMRNLKFILSVLFFISWFCFGMYLFINMIIGMDYPILNDQARYEIDNFHLGTKALYWIGSMIIYMILYSNFRNKYDI